MFDNLFTDEECDYIAQEVVENKHLWRLCPHTNMYVLGNSLLRKIEFLDTGIAYGSYFEDDYFHTSATDLLVTKLSQFYNKIEFIPGFSRPGFQVIKLNENKKPSVWHYDSMIAAFPYERYFKDFDNFDTYFDEKLIFTTMLTDGDFTFDYYPETVSGFGKDFFETSSIKPVCESHANLVGDDCPNPFCALKDGQYETLYYKKGTCLLQDKRFLHRVGLKDLNNSNNLRITMQTYGVVKNNTLYLVW